MGFAKYYFSAKDTDPPSLTAFCTRQVRFEEVDMLRIVWHGRYVSFFDEGREAFGRKYGLSYADFQAARVAAPIVQLKIDYQAPLRYGEVMNIETTLYWCEALRLNFAYRITGPDDRLVARGCTVQLCTDLEGRMLVLEPDFVKDFRQRWQAGELR